MSWLDNWSPWRLRARLQEWEREGLAACKAAARYTRQGDGVLKCIPPMLGVQVDLLAYIAASLPGLREDLRLADECKDTARKERDEAIERLQVVVGQRDAAQERLKHFKSKLAQYVEDFTDAVDGIDEAFCADLPAPCGETAPGPCAGHHSEPDVCQACDRRRAPEHCGPQSTMESER